MHNRARHGMRLDLARRFFFGLSLALIESRYRLCGKTL